MTTYAFIDASNLFYGGEKSLGWKVDYQKLLNYLKIKYGVSKALYFGGVSIHDFRYNYLTHDTVPINAVEQHLTKLLKKSQLPQQVSSLIRKHRAQVRFYKKLDSFGYDLLLKPVKAYYQNGGVVKQKANADVDMTFHMMKEQDNIERAIILSGDGDFLPVLKHLQNNQQKRVIILARGNRTAKEIRQFAGSNFRDFDYLRELVKLK